MSDPPEEKSAPAAPPAPSVAEPEPPPSAPALSLPLPASLAKGSPKEEAAEAAPERPEEAALRAEETINGMELLVEETTDEHAALPDDALGEEEEEEPSTSTVRMDILDLGDLDALEGFDDDPLDGSDEPTPTEATFLPELEEAAPSTGEGDARFSADSLFDLVPEEMLASTDFVSEGSSLETGSEEAAGSSPEEAGRSLSEPPPPPRVPPLPLPAAVSSPSGSFLPLSSATKNRPTPPSAFSSGPLPGASSPVPGAQLQTSEAAPPVPSEKISSPPPLPPPLPSAPPASGSAPRIPIPPPLPRLSSSPQLPTVKLPPLPSEASPTSLLIPDQDFVPNISTPSVVPQAPPSPPEITRTPESARRSSSTPPAGVSIVGSSAATPAEGTAAAFAPAAAGQETPAEGVPLVGRSAMTPAEGTPLVGSSAATPPAGVSIVGSSAATPPEGTAAVGRPGGVPMAPPGPPRGRPTAPPGRPAPAPTRAPKPAMRAAPKPASKPIIPSAAQRPQAPQPKPDFLFPPAMDAPDPSVEWAVRVPSDVQEPGGILACAGDEDIAACWHDRRNKKRYEVFVARFGTHGQKRGPAVSVVPKPGPALNPSITWDGAGFGLFWQDGRKSSADIYYRHLDREGKPDGKEIRLTKANGDSMNPRVLWNGESFAVAYAKQIGDICEIYTLRVHRNGSILGDGEIRVSEGRRNALNPAMIFTGDGYAVTWEDFRNERGHIYFTRLDPNCGPFLYEQRVSIGKTGTSNGPVIAHTGNGFGIAWVEWPEDSRQNNAIHFCRVDNRGHKAGEIHRIITERAIQAPISLLWRKEEFVFLWQDSREGMPQVFAQRVSPEGVRLGGEVRLSNGEGAALYPWAVPTPEGIATAWHSESRETGTYEIFGSMITLPPIP